MLHDDPRCFLRWDVLQRTMFVAYPIYILKELRCLKSQSDWKTRWRPAIMESPAGHPTPYPFMPQSSGNLIHQAYHLCQFETKTGRKVHTFQRVVEFGGGYGRLCSLLHKLGFSGKYLIYDLLPFTLLQKYYLRLSDLPIRQVEGFRSQSNGIWCLSDYDQLKALLTDEMDTSSTLFVAIWSLSETPYNVREAIWKLIKDFDANLIAYQKSFGEMNNLEFFAKWRESLIPKMVWHNWEIEHLQGNYYLVGDRKNSLQQGEMTAMRILLLGSRREVCGLSPITDLANSIAAAGHSIEVFIWEDPRETFHWECQLSVPVHKLHSIVSQVYHAQRATLRNYMRKNFGRLMSCVIPLRSVISGVFDTVKHLVHKSMDRLSLFPWYASVRPYYGNALRKWVRTGLESGDWEIVVAVEAESLVLASEAMKENPIPLVYYSLELFTEQVRRGGRLKADLKYYERLYAAEARCIIIQDRERANVLKEDLRLSDPDFFLLPFGPSDRGIPKPSMFFRDMFGLQLETKLATQIGGIYGSRWSDRLARSADQLPPDYVMVFHGPQLAPFADFVEEEGLNKVFVSDKLVSPAQLFGLYASSRIGMVLYGDEDPNYYYVTNSSHQLALYLMSGIPVIVRSTQPWRKAIDRFGFGLCIDEPSQIADAVIEIDSQYDKFSRNARQAFVEHYALGPRLPALIAKLEAIHGHREKKTDSLKRK